MPFTPDPQKPTSGFRPDAQAPTSGFKPDADTSQNPIDAYYARHANDTIGQKLKALLLGNSDNPAVGQDLGAATMALPMEAAPSALAKIAAYLGKSGLGPATARIAANTAIGGVQGGAKGALISGGIGVLGEGIGALAGGAGNTKDVVGMARNPKGAQDQALEAIDDATQKLRSSEAENLAQQLGGKSLDIDTTKIRGISPEIDDILRTHSMNATPYGQAGDIPSSLKMPAEDANKIRSLLDQELSYKKLGPLARDAEVATKDAHIKSLADSLRGQIHEVSPEVSDTLDQWSENLNVARNLSKRGESAPMTVLSSPSFDRRALLQRVDDQAGTGLQELGAKIANAKDLSNAFHNGGVHPLDALFTLGRTATQGAMKGNSTAIPADALMEGLFKNATDKQ